MTIQPQLAANSFEHPFLIDQAFFLLAHYSLVTQGSGMDQPAYACTQHCVSMETARQALLGCRYRRPLICSLGSTKTQS